MNAKPCPFCGGTDIGTTEGSTFRWWYAFCNTCVAQSGEVRINTLRQDRAAALQQAVLDAIVEWNKRTDASRDAALEKAAEAVDGMDTQDPKYISAAIRALKGKQNG